MRADVVNQRMLYINGRRFSCEKCGATVFTETRPVEDDQIFYDCNGCGAQYAQGVPKSPAEQLKFEGWRLPHPPHDCAVPWPDSRIPINSEWTCPACKRGWLFKGLTLFRKHAIYELHRFNGQEQTVPQGARRLAYAKRPR